jgi:iron-sulfur cluster assembly protein
MRESCFDKEDMEQATNKKKQDSGRQKLSALINVTPSAVAEVRRRLEQEQTVGEKLLRISVEAGGCSGLSYEMGFVAEQTESDHVFDFEGLKVLVDRKTLPYINGLTLDFSPRMVNGGFQFSNPVAKRSCGCGTSFSV